MSKEDKFNSILQSKFNNWQHPVGEADWKEMHNQLNSARKAKMRLKWAAAGGSALVLLSSIGIYAFLNRNIDKNVSTTIPSAINSPTKNNVSATAALSQNVVAAPVKENRSTEKQVALNTVTAKNTIKGNVNPVKPEANNYSAATLPNASNSNISSENNPPATPNKQAGVASSLSVSISGSNIICSGSSTTLCGAVTGGSGEESYLWQPGNFTSKCITVYPATSTVYTLVVTGSSGTATATEYITVKTAPVVSFNSDIYNGCGPVNVQFKDMSTITSGTMNSWSWNFGDGDVSNSQNPVYTYQNAGNYNVSLTVTSDNGCSSTLNIPDMITVYSHPAAGFTLSSASTLAGTTVQFKDKSTDAYGISNWLWNFSDGSVDNTSNAENPSHVYSDTGMYCTKLIVMNTHGCRDSVTNCLAIAPIFNLYIPSAFSPNRDGKNDVFQPEGQYVKSFEMYIFNRQGAQVYHTLDINKGWNGTMNGGITVCPEDTYIYRISVTDSQNKNHEYTGQVTLLK